MDSVWITASLTVLVSTMHGVVQLIRHHMRKKVELARITERGRTERVRRGRTVRLLGGDGERSQPSCHTLRLPRHRWC